MTSLLSKTCNTCKVEQPHAAFSKDARRPGGLNNKCRACGTVGYQANRAKILAYKQSWRDANPELVRERNAATYLKHIDKRKAAALKSREANRAGAAATTAAWRAANTERNKASTALYRAANPEKVAAHLAKWHAANPEKVKASRVRRKALVRGALSIPFTSDHLASRMAYYGNACWMCRGPFEHVDHVKPLSAGGSNLLANLRPSCARCNLSKKAKWFGPAELGRFIRT